MKTPEQIAAETAKKIVPILVNDSYLSYREDAANLILAALTEHAKGLEEENARLKKDITNTEYLWGSAVKLNDQLRARVAELEAQLNDAREYGARMQRERDDRKKLAETWESTATQHLADAIRLENRLNALRLVCGTTDANKFETTLDRANERIKELEARILSDNKAYGCELRDPNGTIWEYAETLKKRVDELENELAKVQLVADHRAKTLTELEADRERLEYTFTTNRYFSDRATIDSARNAQPAANTGDNHRTEDKL